MFQHQELSPTTNGITGGGDLTANRTLSLDSTVVRTTGNQTIEGSKTFSSPVVVAPPTGSTHVNNQKNMLIQL